MSAADWLRPILNLPAPRFVRARRLVTLPELRCATDGRMHPAADFDVGRYGTRVSSCIACNRARAKTWYHKTHPLT